MLDTSVLANAGVAQTAEWLAVSIADGFASRRGRLVAGLSGAYPYASVETTTEFRQRIEGMVEAR